MRSVKFVGVWNPKSDQIVHEFESDDAEALIE